MFPHILSLSLVSLTRAHYAQNAFLLANINEDPIPFSTRAHWMRVAISALSDLSSPCPFAAFGTAIVNHTSASPTNPIGDLICIGVNSASITGNPILHGEIAAINNCSSILRADRDGGGQDPRREETGSVWGDLSLYTTAEACPMCASAIRWVGFKEYIYGTSIKGLVERGWGQINISSREIFERSGDLAGRMTRLVGGVLSNETDGLFDWQFDDGRKCPNGCVRNGEGWCTTEEAAKETF
ncbi:guanine deaminase [Bisporella sp. PMI_857]|nr:guanine deaminase [Bisporella sp. PMI_857]